MARGFDWLLLAANAGHAPAMGIVGAIVRHGERGVVAQNVTAARTWFEQGVLRNDSASQNGLARMLLRGDGGIKRDVYRAKMLLERSANHGESLALVTLAMMRLLGVASVRSYSGAQKLVARAASRQTAGPRVYALHLHARMNALGIGTPRSCSSAVALYKQVAERGEWVEALEDARDDVERGALKEALRKYVFLSPLYVMYLCALDSPHLFELSLSLSLSLLRASGTFHLRSSVSIRRRATRRGSSRRWPSAAPCCL